MPFKAFIPEFADDHFWYVGSEDETKYLADTISKIRGFGDTMRTETEHMVYHNIRDYALGGKPLIYDNQRNRPQGGFYKLDEMVRRDSIRLNGS